MSLEDGTADGGVLDFCHPCDSSKFLLVFVIGIKFGLLGYWWTNPRLIFYKKPRLSRFLDFGGIPDPRSGGLVEDLLSRHSFVEQT